MKTKNKIGRPKKIEVKNIVNTYTLNPEKDVNDILDESATVEPIAPTVKIAPFTGDFGRADIDSLRDKVNEIIDFLNK